MKCINYIIMKFINYIIMKFINYIIIKCINEIKKRNIKYFLLNSIQISESVLWCL